MIGCPVLRHHTTKRIAIKSPSAANHKTLGDSPFADLFSIEFISHAPIDVRRSRDYLTRLFVLSLYVLPHVARQKRQEPSLRSKPLGSQDCRGRFALSALY
jgi:hypothetical protein